MQKKGNAEDRLQKLILISTEQLPHYPFPGLLTLALACLSVYIHEKRKNVVFNK